MIYISYAVLFSIIAYTFFKRRDIAHPIILFLGLWLCSLICANLRLYNMRKFSDTGVNIILIGLVGFMIGCIISKSILKIGLHIVVCEDTSPKEHKFRLSSKLLYFFLAMAYFGILILLLYVMKNLSHGVPYSYIRNMYYGYGQAKKLIPNTFLNQYVNWVSVPCLYALIPVAFMNIFEWRADKRFSILVFIAVALYIFGSAGRFMLMFLVVQAVAMLQFYNVRVSKKVKKYMVVSIILLISILIIITKIRAHGASGKKVNSIYAYLTLPVYLLDYWVERSSDVKNLDGAGFLYGILTLANYISSKFGVKIPFYQQAYDIIQVTQDKWVNVFPNEWYNAYVSMFYYFYMDFGITGVILGCIFFGYICYYAYYKAFIERDKTALLYYMLLVQCIICSLVRWQIGSIVMVMTFIVEYFITFNRFKLKIPSVKLKLYRNS